MSKATVFPVRAAPDIAAAVDLAWQFFEFAKQATGRPDLVEGYLADHRVVEKFADFENHYLPPMGDCLLARLEDGTAVGVVMLTTKTPQRCEMNRMFVSDKARGLGVGRLLGMAVLQRGAEMGFDEMTLDTLKVFESAVGLYRALGFVDDTRPDLYHQPGNDMGVHMCRPLTDLAPHT